MSNDSSSFQYKLQLYFIQKLKLVSVGTDVSSAQALTELNNLAKLVEKIITLEQHQIDDEFQARFSEFPLARVQSEFKVSLFAICLQEILGCTNLNRIIIDLESGSNGCDKSTFNSFKASIVNIISATNYQDSFNVLYELCITLEPSNHRDLCLFFLKHFLVKHLLKELLIEKTIKSQQNKHFGDNANFVQKLINLPDKLSNRHMQNLSATFSTKEYFKIVSTDLLLCLKTIHSETTNQEAFLNGDISFELLSLVIGKILLLGHSESVSNTLINNLLMECYKNSSWTPIVNKVLTSMPYKYLENVLLILIKSSSCYKDLCLILGDSILNNKDIQYFLLDKFLFLKVLNKDIYIQNLIGYLYDSKQRRQFYYSIFKKLLNTWSNHASIANTSYEQHLYLTKCILVCVSFMDSDDQDSIAYDLIKPLLSGVEKHLQSPIQKIQHLGMIVGENLMNDINKLEESPKLKFEYNESNDEIQTLIRLRQKPSTKSAFETKLEAQDESSLLNLYSMEMSDCNKKLTTNKVIFNNDNLKLKITMGTNDSDDEDDLIPYDTSNDVSHAKAKKPAYLRDCLDVLIYSEDPEKIEMSLKNVESLCNSYHFELEEVCVELLKVILHKANAYNIEGFEEARMNAMISITVHYPKQCAQYLTSQFYEREYSITHRTDILHVLVMSVQKISNPNEDPLFDKRLLNIQSNKKPVSLVAINQNTMGSEQPNWKQIVQQRIDSKTKIKSSKTSKKEPPKAKENKSSELFGYFFFPLLKPYDVNRVHLKIMENDYMLLGKLIFSLSVILYSSINTTVLDNMISSLLNFIWTLRNHIEPYVRKSILFAFMLIMLAIPENFMLFSSPTTNKYLAEMKFWLENVALNDPNTYCQMQAVDCLKLLAQKVQGTLLQKN